MPFFEEGGSNCIHVESEPNWHTSIMMPTNCKAEESHCFLRFFSLRKMRVPLVDSMLLRGESPLALSTGAKFLDSCTSSKRDHQNEIRSESKEKICSLASRCYYYRAIQRIDCGNAGPVNQCNSLAFTGRSVQRRSN